MANFVVLSVISFVEILDLFFEIKEKEFYYACKTFLFISYFMAFSTKLNKSKTIVKLLVDIRHVQH